MLMITLVNGNQYLVEGRAIKWAEEFPDQPMTVRPVDPEEHVSDLAPPFVHPAHIVEFQEHIDAESLVDRPVS